MIRDAHHNDLGLPLVFRNLNPRGQLSWSASLRLDPIGRAFPWRETASRQLGDWPSSSATKSGRIRTNATSVVAAHSPQRDIQMFLHMLSPRRLALHNHFFAGVEVITSCLSDTERTARSVATSVRTNPRSALQLGCWRVRTQSRKLSSTCFRSPSLPTLSTRTIVS